MDRAEAFHSFREHGDLFRRFFVSRSFFRTFFLKKGAKKNLRFPDHPRLRYPAEDLGHDKWKGVGLSPEYTEK